MICRRVHCWFSWAARGCVLGLAEVQRRAWTPGANTEQLDFDSVQRGNPEMQRRAQEVIDRCWALGANNPVLSIHDVGAGGLSNAMPELADQSKRGARIALAAIPVEESGMSPLEIWCNESQERYALAIAPDRLTAFDWLARRERCPYAVIGRIADDGQLVIDASGQPARCGHADERAARQTTADASRCPSCRAIASALRRRRLGP